MNGFCLFACADPGIFCQWGGVQVSLTKKSQTVLLLYFFFSPQLILQKSNGQFQRNLSFFKVLEGVQLIPGRGSNCLFPIETHITCAFPGGGGGPDPLSPPSGSALVLTFHLSINEMVLLSTHNIWFG